MQDTQREKHNHDQTRLTDHGKKERQTLSAWQCHLAVIRINALSQKGGARGVMVIVA